MALTDQPIALGGLGLARILPVIMFSPLGGAVIWPPSAVVSGGIGCFWEVGWIARRWPQFRRYNGDEPIKTGAMAD